MYTRLEIREKEKPTAKSISDYYEVNFLAPYDLSVKTKEKHDNYLKKYRKHLKRICEFSYNFESVYAKRIVSEYVDLTVHNGCKLSPQKAYELVKQQVKLIAECDSKPIILDSSKCNEIKTIDCTFCRKKTKIPASFASYEFLCIPCFLIYYITQHMGHENNKKGLCYYYKAGIHKGKAEVKIGKLLYCRKCAEKNSAEVI